LKRYTHINTEKLAKAVVQNRVAQYFPLRVQTAINLEGATDNSVIADRVNGFALTQELWF
jgi:hypothetical protein